ncbi:NAPDH-dependent diflavin reductase [Dispira simplex]|nr:NAPDH-dependent diflavin reductase [Dispira simplex]
MHEPILILYGSQTGCAEDVALRIGREARRRHFQPEIMALDDLPKSRLGEPTLAIFVCSTTGQGEEPDNMKSFWRFLLRKSLPENTLANLEFTVFGLGDSSYAKFNFPARKIYRRVVQLGGRCFYPSGEGDDQHYLGIDGMLDPWLRGLWETLLSKYPLPSDCPIVPESVQPEASFRVELMGSVPESQQVASDPHYPSNVVYMDMVKNQRITSSDHFQDVRHIILRRSSQSSSPVVFQPGDTAQLFPRNIPSEVQEFLTQMNWVEIADQPLVVHPNLAGIQLPPYLPNPTTLRTLFECYFDIYSVPRRSFFEMLAYFTDDPMETEKLREFCSTEGQDDLYAYSHRVRRTIVEVLRDFKSHHIPLDYLFDIFPDIRPRAFSIASSLHAHPDEIHLTIGIVEYWTKLSTQRRGVCTKWLKALDPAMNSITLPVTLKRGTMRLPTSPAVPVIMVGPGTGVAPMRSFIQERVYQGAKKNILFFGCRYTNKDFYYQDEWQALQAEGYLEYFAACSRDQVQKVYVQHLIREQAEYLWNLIHHQQAVVLISGNANRMPEDVKEAFTDIVRQEGNLQQADAQKYIHQLEKSNRYLEECWY